MQSLDCECFAVHSWQASSVVGILLQLALQFVAKKPLALRDIIAITARVDERILFLIQRQQL